MEAKSKSLPLIKRDCYWCDSAITGTDPNLKTDNKWHEATRHSPPFRYPELHITVGGTLEHTMSVPGCWQDLKSVPLGTSKHVGELQMPGKPDGNRG